MVWLDVEDDCQKKLGATLVALIHAYKAVVEGAGLPFGVYTGTYFYKDYIKPYGDLIVLCGLPDTGKIRGRWM